MAAERLQLSVYSAALGGDPAPTSHLAGDSSWFAIFTAPQPRSVPAFERYAAEIGIETFAPRRITVRRAQVRLRGRKPRVDTEIVSVPLLGRYVLVRLPQIDTPFRLFLNDCARQAGVSAIVGTVRHGPTAIPASIVDELQRRNAAGEFDATIRRGRRVLSVLPEWAAVGATVRITAGAFRDYIGLVEEHAGEGRVRVAITIFGRQTPIEIEMVDLSAERRVLPSPADLTGCRGSIKEMYTVGLGPAHP